MAAPYVCKIVGLMFSGKTDTALRHVSRWLDSGRAAAAVYVSKNGDQRYGEGADGVASHRGASRVSLANVRVFRCDSLAADAVCAAGGGARLVVIDEAQFFPEDELHSAVAELARRGFVLYVCGLDFDSSCRVFGGVLSLPADETIHLHAICVECGAPAPFTRRHTPAPAQVAVGGRAEYSAVCRLHHPALAPIECAQA